MDLRILVLGLLSALALATPIVKDEAQSVESRQGFITSSTKQNIKIKKKTFKCTIKLVHDWLSVNLAKSSLKCTPGKPKKQKASNIKVSANDFGFVISVSINPSK